MTNAELYRNFYLKNNSEKLVPAKNQDVSHYILNQDIELIEFNSEEKPIKHFSFHPENRFVFVLNLQDRIYINGKNTSASLPPFYHVLFKSSRGKIKIDLPNQHHKGCILLCSEKYIKKTMEDADHSFSIEEFYNEEVTISRPNLALCERVGEIKDVRKLYHDRLIALGYAHIILGIAIKQAIETKNGIYSHTSSLSNREINSIQKLIREINENPSFEYSVNYLADEAGISIPKLQTGFKEIVNMTVANYIRDVRLQESEKLLKSSDLNVSEIVYSIGFSSRSYFSRIFKKKYNCSPSEYQKQCQLHPE